MITIERYSDCCEGDGHWSDPVFIFKVEMIGFAERLDGRMTE